MKSPKVCAIATFIFAEGFLYVRPYSSWIFLSIYIFRDVLESLFPYKNVCNQCRFFYLYHECRIYIINSESYLISRRSITAIFAMAIISQMQNANNVYNTWIVHVTNSLILCRVYLLSPCSPLHVIFPSLRLFHWKDLWHRTPKHPCGYREGHICLVIEDRNLKKNPTLFLKVNCYVTGIQCGCG